MEQTKQLNMTAMSDKTNSNTTAKKEEPAWEHKVAMKVSGVSIAVNLLLSLFKLLAGIVAHSGAMISDAIHSASDVGSTCLLYTSKTAFRVQNLKCCFIMLQEIIP